jgi:hypothetical protein
MAASIVIPSTGGTVAVDTTPPTTIPAATVFSTPVDKQILFKLGIRLEGGLDLRGALVGVK